MLQEVEPLKVFISSVMRRALEDLSAEREATRLAIESWDPVAHAWAFENEPASTKRLRESYIDEVKTCDLMVLIVGKTMTPAVRDEVMAARAHDKGILAFAKAVAEKEPGAEEVFRLFDAKYERFTNAADLGPKVRRAVGLEIRRRAEPGSKTTLGDHIASLRELKRIGAVIRITPMIPKSARDLFRIADVNSDLLVLNKSGTGAQVTIPVPRVYELLNMGLGDAPLVGIDGRLQWITIRREWIFFPERPNPNDALHLGVPKEVDRRHSPLSALSQGGYVFVWSRRDLLAGRMSDGTHEVFYDDDGHYLQSVGQVLMVRR
jgi:hypothetical protein